MLTNVAGNLVDPWWNRHSWLVWLLLGSLWLIAVVVAAVQVGQPQVLTGRGRLLLVALIIPVAVLALIVFNLPAKLISNGSTTPGNVPPTCRPSVASGYAPSQGPAPTGRPMPSPTQGAASAPGARMSVAVAANCDAYAFTLSSAGTIVYAQQTSVFSSGWTAFTAVPGSPSDIDSAPAAVADADGHLEVLARDSTGQVVDGWQDKTSGGWLWDNAVTGGPLPGTPVGDPGVTLAPGGEVAMVVRLSNGNVIATEQQDPNGTKGWTNWTNLHGDIAGNPVPFTDSDGRLDVFAITSSGTLAIDQLPGGGEWLGWSTVHGSSGQLVADPAPVNNLNDSTEVFVTTSSGSADHVWRTGADTWSWGVPVGNGGPTTLGATISGSMTAIEWPDGHVEVFARLSDGTLAHAWQLSPNGAAGWSAWGRLPGSPAAAPHAFTSAGNTVELIYLSHSAQAAFNFWESSSTQWSQDNLIGGGI
ncbi:MAG TPA: hypothetical protein VGS97_02450 [Actinocrinis sp.]|uniref:hypothetical protein n=1 Tax=Actinocrinis sp. TaxID=1920516 RepID=UPI002DDCC18E|nr:hypothetical protein [Actinocrinis sp.]HEV2342930.1 hypothetical protein [Actinocrinis sp.]